MKCYILFHRTWTDFDIEKLTPVLVSLEEKLILNEMKTRNSRLTREQIMNEEEYQYSWCEYK